MKLKIIALMLVLLMFVFQAFGAYGVISDTTLTADMTILPGTDSCGSITTGNYNLIVDSNVVLKFAPGKGIIHNGTGLVHFKGTLNNPIYITVLNDNSVGVAISGSTGYPNYLQQTVPNLQSSSSGCDTADYTVFKYMSIASGTAVNGVCVYSNTAAQANKRMVLRNCIFQYVTTWQLEPHIIFV